MASIEVLTERFSTHEKMYCQDLREQSFADWPFREECNCTPEKVSGPLNFIKLNFISKAFFMHSNTQYFTK